MKNELKKILAETGITQVEFAKLAGINPCSLSIFLNKKDDHSIYTRIFPYVFGEKKCELMSKQKHPKE